jgi:hypothetical protein
MGFWFELLTYTRSHEGKNKRRHEGTTAQTHDGTNTRSREVEKS